MNLRQFDDRTNRIKNKLRQMQLDLVDNHTGPDRDKAIRQLYKAIVAIGSASAYVYEMTKENHGTRPLV